MRLLHYLEIENFKRFGDKQRIELDHPAVLIGPNNCGKTSAIQAVALSSFAREFFKRFAERVGGQMLLKKGELHRLVALVDAKAIAAEVSDKLNALRRIFERANPDEELSDVAQPSGAGAS